MSSKSGFSKKRTRSNTPYSWVNYEPLEARQVMAAGITLVDGTVYIEGTNDRDTVDIVMTNETTVSVSMTDFETETYQLSQVNKIRFRGLDGNDRLTNRTDIDLVAFGHDGDDRIVGGNGINRIQGGDGDDIIFGGDRNDLLKGRDGDDIIIGGLRHDRIFGGGNDDQILGQHGRDLIYGEGGNDQLIGGQHNDRISGGEGDDDIEGEHGNDRIFGDEGDDDIRGGDGNDKLFGGEGNDTIRGENGSDEIDGDLGQDELRGGNGNDVLFGGVGSSDQLYGDSGRDRFLVHGLDQANNVAAIDAVIEFVDDTNVWTDQQIKTIDSAFKSIAQESNGKLDLLKDSVSENPVQFVNANVARNQVVDGVRQISIPNWDPTNATQDRNAFLSTINQTAFTWDSVAEIQNFNTGNVNQLTNFFGISQWQFGTNVPSGFVASTNGQWSYHQNTQFADDRGRFNPSADWATAWELALDPDANQSDVSRISSKIYRVRSFFDTLN